MSETPEPTPTENKTRVEVDSDLHPPAYEKPKLRRYDQIEQVKPYGPSERKAG